MDTTTPVAEIVEKSSGGIGGRFQSVMATQ
jgi:hypothetical protein